LTTSPASNAIANGRSIFITGRDVDGVQITARARPLFQSCAACHKANGSGGVHFPDGAVSADLRHGALTQGDHPYTIALLQRAISKGIDNEGKPLDRVMPRWRMSQHDLRDVATYVFTQLK
jgi:mono/diheme cytochrome c family protein